MTTTNQNPNGDVAPPPLNKRDAKAQAAANKAYAKANRNWFARHKFLTGLGALVVLIIVIVAANSGGGDSSSTDAASGTTHAATGHKATDKKAVTKKAAPSSDAYGSRKLPLQDGDWRLDSVQVKDDGLGSLGGTARITYTGGDSDGGDNVFTITLFKGKDVVGTLEGSATTVLPGSTATVQLISTDDFVGGPYKYDFENNL